jgi:hypothetical protein
MMDATIAHNIKQGLSMQREDFEARWSAD